MWDDCLHGVDAFGDACRADIAGGNAGGTTASAKLWFGTGRGRCHLEPGGYHKQTVVDGSLRTLYQQCLYAVGAFLASSVFAYAEAVVFLPPPLPRFWHESHFDLYVDWRSTYAVMVAAFAGGGTFSVAVEQDSQGNRGNPL